MKTEIDTPKHEHGVFVTLKGVSVEHTDDNTVTLRMPGVYLSEAEQEMIASLFPKLGAEVYNLLSCENLFKHVQ